MSDAEPVADQEHTMIKHKFDGMRIFTFMRVNGVQCNHTVPAEVILRLLDARTDEDAVKAAAAIRKVASRYDNYTGESDDVLGWAWRVADWPDANGVTQTERLRELNGAAINAACCG